MQIPNPSVSHFPSSPLATTSLFPELLFIIRSLKKTRHRLTWRKNLWVTETKAVSGTEKSPKLLGRRFSCWLIIRGYLIICSKSQILYLHWVGRGGLDSMAFSAEKLQDCWVWWGFFKSTVFEVRRQGEEGKRRNRVMTLSIQTAVYCAFLVF